MADEAIYIYASQVTLEASGGSSGSGAFVAANDAALSSTNHKDYPVGDCALTCDFGAAVAAGVVVHLFRQDLNIDSTADAPAPATTFEEKWVGAFAIPSGQSASATYSLPNVPLTKECQFSLKNGTAQTISAGWVLKITPKTYGPAT